MCVCVCVYICACMHECLCVNACVVACMHVLVTCLFYYFKDYLHIIDMIEDSCS